MQRCLNARFGCDAPEIRTVARPAPAQQHSPTSRAAAASIDGKQRHRDRVRVFGAFQSAGLEGLTDEELIDKTGIAANTARPRRIDLVKENVVRDSGRSRVTKSGRQAVVWCLYDALYGGEPQPLAMTAPDGTSELSTEHRINRP